MGAEIFKGKEYVIPIQKSEIQFIDNSQTLLSPPYDKSLLRSLMDYSTILSQCNEAYKQNIAGFGISPKYIEDETTTGESSAKKAEWNRMDDLLDSLNDEMPLKEVFETAILHREETGEAYIEVLRNLRGEVVGLENIDPVHMLVTRKLVGADGKKYRRYCYRDGVNEVWYKALGDPTSLNIDGSIDEGTTDKGTATEVLHLKIGDGAYGVPRWIGALLDLLGDREAGELNYSYFTEGRHTPLALITNNAQLTPETEQKLKEYANGGKSARHKILWLGLESDVPEDMDPLEAAKKKGTAELVKMADVLQSDALFLEYSDKVREKVLSKYRLPPVYIGLSNDYNRATVETARELTEEQVFQPERAALAWRINRLFREYGFQHVEVTLDAPKIENPDDTARILDVLVKAGAVAPNDVRDLLGRVLGKDLEAFQDESYNTPGSTAPATSLEPMAKAYGDHDLGELAGEIRRIVHGRNA